MENQYTQLGGKVMDIFTQVHERILALRNIETLIKKQGFKRLWNASDKEQRKIVTDAINNFDRESISDWMYTHPDIDYGEMPILALKEIARKLSIPNYSRLNKAALIMEITDAKNQHSK